MTSSARRVTRDLARAVPTEQAGLWSSRIASGTAPSESSSSRTSRASAEQRSEGAARRGAFEIFRLATGVAGRG